MTDRQYNIWTGRGILDIDDNARIVRQPFVGQRPLYSAEYWGDYSLEYPVRGQWRETLRAAKSDLAALKAKGIK